MKEFPPVHESTVDARYHTPHILLEAKDGHVHFIEARAVMCQHTTRAWYSLVREEREVFKVKAPARFTIAGNTVNVLCDGDTPYHGKTYAATIPSASEYRAMAGREVRIYFECKPLLDKVAAEQFEALPSEKVYYCGETFIILPELKDEQ